MATINKVNLAALEQVTKEAETDPSKAKSVQKVEGEWLLEEALAQAG